MTSIEIQRDLEVRQKLLTSVSVFTSLRKMIKLLCTCYIAAVSVWLLFNFVLTLRLGSGEFLLVFVPSLVIAALSLVLALVVKGLALAFIDTVDLKLLENRRSELDRKEAKE